MYYLRKTAKKKERPAAEKKRKPTLATLTARLDRTFSRYIRLRDAMPGGLCRCISCGQIKPVQKMDCGHYFSRRSMATRFDEDNCHAECAYCNRFNAEHLHAYRDNLLRKIGTQRFALLEVRHNQTRKWSAWELEQLITHYNGLIAALSKEKGITL